MTTRATTAEELAAVADVAAQMGCGPVEPVVVSLAKHTIIRLAPLPLVARVRSGDGLDTARAALAGEVRVASYLATRRAPVLRPARSIDPGPHIWGRCAMTLWEFTPHRPTADDADIGQAAAALRRVHAALAAFSEPLPPFTDTIDDCGERIAKPGGIGRLAEKDRRFLHMLHARLRGRLHDFACRSVPIHGDAHLGNALLTDAGVVWGDFEAVCMGPREWDIACLPADIWPAFDGFDPDLTRCLADLRSLCVAVWCWADHGRSPATGEAAAYHLGALRERFDPS